MPLPSHIRCGGGQGTEFRGPLIGKPFSANTSWRQEIPDYSYRYSPWLVLDRMEDFEGEIPYLDFYIPLVLTSSNTDTVATGGSSGVSKAQLTVPRSGVITSIGFASESAVTQSSSTYLTFTGTNYLGAGAGSTAILSTTAHVNTTDSNAAAINAGSNLLANTEYALTVHGTAANLNVVEGDVIEVVATATSTGAATNAPYVHFRVSTTPVGWYPRVKRTAGLVQAKLSANVANGEFAGLLTSTNEAQTVGLDWHDQLAITRPDVSPNFNPWGGPILEAFVNFPVALGASQNAVIGLGTAFNSTLASTAEYAWFRLTANMNVTIEGNDGTTATLAQAPAGGTFTLTAGTYYLFTIDMTDYSNVAFFVNQVFIGTIPMTALVNTILFQPMAYVQKTTGTSVPGIKVDFMRAMWLRF